jgi:hypothetical protein
MADITKIDSSIQSSRHPAWLATLRVIAFMTTQHCNASTSSGRGRDRTAKAREGCLGSRYKNGTSSQGFSTFQSLPYTALQSDRCLVITTFCYLLAPFHGGNARGIPQAVVFLEIVRTRRTLREGFCSPTQLRRSEKRRTHNS